MDVSSKISGFSHKKAEDYSTLEEIQAHVEFLTHENFLLTQATDVFERFLRKKNPNLLLGLDKTTDLGSRISEITSRSVSFSPSLASASPGALTRTSTISSAALTSRSLVHSSLATHRINIIYRIEIVEKEIEEGKMLMDKLRKRFASAKFLLQSEEENTRMDIEVLKESKTSFEDFFKENTEKKTGRVFHDKFLRFLENELQLRDRELRKMRLKTKTYQIEYNRMKSQQQQKLELRERLHPVDLDKLRIENEEQLKLLEQKTKQLLDLKKTVGKKGQSLVLTKSKLNDIILNLKSIRQDIKQKEAKYDFIDAKESENMNELVAAELMNQSIKRIHDTYKSPDVHSYIMIEVKLGELKKEKEVLERRCRNQKQTLTLLEHQVKQIVPSDSRSHSRSLRSKSLYSSRSAGSTVKQSQGKSPSLHCTPTTPL